MEHAVLDTQPTGRVAALVEAWRAGRLRCATSGQVIRGRFVRRNGQVFHPDHVPTDRPTRAVTTGSTTQVIGTLRGCAAMTGVINPISVRGVTTLDRLVEGCFSRSLQEGGQVLKLNHSVVVPGAYRRLAMDAGRLLFAFDLHDSVIGRQIVNDVRAGRVKGASASYRTIRSSWVYEVKHIQEAALSEISVLRAPSRPALLDTYVRLVA